MVTSTDVPDAHVAVYQAKYEGGGAGTVGVMVKGDGSATCKYPDDSPAVTVSSSIQHGRIVYSMMAIYQSTRSVAATFEPDGSGCVQHANGEIMLTFNAGTRTGMVLARGGKVRLGLERGSRTRVSLTLTLTLTPPNPA